MVSHISLITLLGYAAAFWCLDALPGAGKILTSTSAFVLRLAAGALLPAVLATFGLTSLLLFAHVRALGGANAGTAAAAAARRRRLLDRLANATLAATAAALLAVAVLWLGDDGYLGGGGGYGGVGWLWLSAE